MDLYPAIDLRGGACVRLVQGDYDRETVYGRDPVSVARGFAAAGASWLHVVDLDAARTGAGVNHGVVGEIAGAVGIPVQVGGGLRDEVAVRRLLDAGVARVVLGTAAAEEPDLVRRLAARHPGQVAVGVDVRDGEVQVRGWRAGSGISGGALVGRFADAGVAAFVVTDISRDGTLGGPALAGLAAVLEATAVAVIASGGVGSLDDLARLASLEAGGRRLAGAIVGKALYDRRFDVTEAVAACAR